MERHSRREKLFRILLISIFFIAASFLHAAERYGSLNGRITDYKTGKPLVGANVILTGTFLGAATDIDGNYTIYDIPPGIYEILITYVGYEKQVVKQFQLQPAENHYLNVALIPSVMNLSEIVVEAEAQKHTDAYLISEKKRSLNLQDGVSGTQMARTGDANAVDAVKRITGVTVFNDNTVYVRGLGDRYVTTQMNGAPLPSPEPEKKSVPLNLFSTGILESITAYKTFTPDLPGVFGGGTVDIKTKAYPDKRMFSVSSGLSFSTDLADAKYRVGSQGALDFWGFDDGTRQIPSKIPENTLLTKYPTTDLFTHYNTLGDYGEAFKSGMKSSPATPMLPISFGFNTGNRYTPSQNFEYGYYANMNFSNDYGYQEETYRKYAVSENHVSTRTDLVNQKSSYKTTLNLTGSTGLKFYENHSLKLVALYTHTSENTYTYGMGKTPNLDEKGIYLHDYFAEKSIFNTTLTGMHHFNRHKDHQLEWRLNTGLSKLSEPDTKSHNYKYYPSENIYRLASSSAKAGMREFTDGFDFNGNVDMNYIVKFKDRYQETYTFKTGGRLQYNFRSFQKRSFYHEHSLGSWPDDLIAFDETTPLDEFGNTFSSENYFSYNPAENSVKEGIILLESTDGASRNAYDAEEINNAFYWMIDAPVGIGHFEKLNNFRIVTGFRIEDYHITLSPYNPVTGDSYQSDILYGQVIKTDRDETVLLPSLNLIYHDKKNQKVRVSYSNTVARPEFREMAPFEFQAFYGGNPIVGFPYLKTTRIRNYDIRYEKYKMAGEIFSTGIFFKNFTNPIEKVIIETADESYLTFQNADYAYTYGVEIDYRSYMPILPVDKGKIMVIFNVTLSQSQVKSPEKIQLFTGATTLNHSQTLKRPLQGQSNIILNASLNYTGLQGISSSISYNAFSPRLYALGSGDAPNEYEYPFHSLNLTISKTFGALNVSLKMKNLLNSEMKFGFNKDGKRYITNQYHPGIGASVSLSYAM